MFLEKSTLIGSSAKFRKTLEQVKELAAKDNFVLFVGERGTGKKTLSRFLHSESSRHSERYSEVDCSVSDQELENAVLGYRDEETGRFHKGVIEKSHKGSVCFLNIDQMNKDFQKRLFQIINELGDYEIDLRVTATTTKNLSKQISAGNFHRPLYNMFTSGHVNIQPLRERTSDIMSLLDFATNEFNKRNITNKTFTESSRKKMLEHYWTYNLSELFDVVERTLSQSEDEVIDYNDILFTDINEETGDRLISEEDGFKLMSLKEAEKLLIKKALIHTSENRTQAAKILGVSIRTLRNKINEYRGDGSNYFINLR